MTAIQFNGWHGIGENELPKYRKWDMLKNGLQAGCQKKIDPHALAQGLLYVGLSRAQSYLYLVGTRSVLGKIGLSNR